MKLSGNFIYRKALLLLAIILMTTTLSARTLKVGIISDGNTKGLEDLLVSTAEELKRLILDSDSVEFVDKLRKSGDWDIKATNEAIDSLLANKEADVVLGFGPVASHLLAQRQKFARPAMASHIINAQMQGLTTKDGASGVHNFCFVDLGLDIGRHIDRFQEIKAFKTLHLIVSPYLLDGIPQMADYLAAEAEKRGVKLITVRALADLNKVSVALYGAEAVYIAPLIDLSPEQRNLLILKINAMKIPSMTMLGRAPVENGVFASIAMEIDTQKLARRLALNFQRLFFDENPSVFQTGFPHVERLTINMQTAREIGLFPTWEQMTDAILLNEEPDRVEKQLSITQVVEIALARNLRILAKKQELAVGAQGINRAKANLRPKVSAFGRQSVLDEDRADSIMTPAQHQTQIGADLMMVIYNEPARANIDMQRLFQAARQEEERVLLLDIIKDSALAYLNVLKAKTLQAIQRDNIEVTRANLEIARFREQVGMSGPAEVYRWEIQMASARQAIVDASAMRKKAELALNQVLDAAQEEEFTTADCDIFAEVFFLDYAKIAPYIDNLHGYKIFRDFLVADTFAFAPELQQVGKAIAAYQRAHKSAKSRYNKPTLALQGNFSRTIKESGVGEVKPAMPAPFNSVFTYPDKNDWYVGLNVSIPLHEGGDRPAAVKEAAATVKKLEKERDYLMQRLELNTRASLEDARASFSSIGLSETRSGYAAKALEIVQSAYTRGAVNILDLIDAQNASLVAREASTNAVFTFLSDFIKVCRAVGTFDFMLNPQTNSHWYERLQIFYASSGGYPLIDRRPTEKKGFEPETPQGKILYRDDL